MKRNRWKTAAALLVVVLCVALGVAVAMAATERHAKSPAEFSACKEALRELFENAQATGAEGYRPDACRNLTDDELNRLANEVIAEGAAR